MLQVITKPFIDFKIEITLALKFFLGAALLGGIFSLFKIHSEKDLADFILPIYKDILDDGNFTFEGMFFGILQRNLTAALISIGLGVIYRYLPLLVISLNGFILGVFVLAFGLYGPGGPIELLNLFPHGVFEIPALFLATGLGIGLSRITTVRNIFGRAQMVIKSYKVIGVVIGLLIIAATIESFFITFKI